MMLLCLLNILQEYTGESEGGSKSSVVVKLPCIAELKLPTNPNPNEDTNQIYNKGVDRSKGLESRGSGMMHDGTVRSQKTIKTSDNYNGEKFYLFVRQIRRFEIIY